MLEKEPHLQHLEDIGFPGPDYTYAYRDNISVDPIGFESGDVNLMRYVGGNPVNVVDPLGLWSVWGGGSGTIAVGRGLGYSFGLARDSNNGGRGTYTSDSHPGGFAASAGLEFGYYSGAMDGPTTSINVGLYFLGIGLIFGKDGLGVSLNVSLGVPFQATFSMNETEFLPTIPLMGTDVKRPSIIPDGTQPNLGKCH